MPKYSIIVPTYNRSDEVKELIDSLLESSEEDFEILLIDGSPENVLEEVDQYQSTFHKHLQYRRIHVPHLGISDSRNLGAEKSSGEYLIFFDSDIIVPADYFAKINSSLLNNAYDIFGGPDASHESFNATQKAISYCMTSILTTGGIRGKKVHVGSFRPRGFNMGIKKTVFDQVNGFDTFFKVSEDMDISARVIAMGFKSGLIVDAFVYHKRRVSLEKFYRQVFRYGAGRILLAKSHPGEMKIVHLFPIAFIVFLILGPLLLFVSFSFFVGWLALILSYFIANMLSGTILNKSFKVGGLIIPTLLTQFFAYANGFVKNWIYVHILKISNGIFEKKKGEPDSPT